MSLMGSFTSVWGCSRHFRFSPIADVARPALSGIGDDAHRMAILAFHEVADQRLAVGVLFVGLAPSAAKSFPQNRLAPGMCHGWLPEALSKASDAYAKLPDPAMIVETTAQRNSILGSVPSVTPPNSTPPPVESTWQFYQGECRLFCSKVNGR